MISVPYDERLAGETSVEFQCGVAANPLFDEEDPEFCTHEPEQIDLDGPAVVEDNGERIQLPGRPADCPECGEPVLFEFNGLPVMFP